MQEQLAFTLAHADYYEPLELIHPGLPYRPSGMPEDWSRSSREIWTEWAPPGAQVPEQGWKIHVSSAVEDAPQVLDLVAAACVEFSVSFKHLSGKSFFLWMHSKHGSRAQGGKFCALYPPDQEVARALLLRLERDLAGFAGPYVRSDRRFGSCVFYRYGSFRERFRLRPDGTREAMLLDPAGREIPDERRPEFVLPPGVTDPFAAPEDDGDEGVSFGGYTFEAVLQHSNAGGAYRARAAGGREVFVKEAWAHTGYDAEARSAQLRLEQEYETLKAVHAKAPGLCPEPVELFSHWENTYLVTELVPGTTLSKWVVANSPVVKIGQPPEVFADYYRRCLDILGQAEAAVAALHDLGYAFVDVNPKNLLVDDDLRVRLVDFEAAHLLTDGAAVPLGAPGYIPREAFEPGRSMDARDLDDYALAAVAQLMVFPLHEVVIRAPEVLDHVHHDLTALAPVPGRLWSRVTRVHPRPRRRSLPTPDEVERDPLTWLSRLRNRTADAIETMAQPGNPRWVYPTTPAGFSSNTRCVAHGTAGVLHALHVAGRPVDRKIVVRLRDESLAERHSLPPGLLYGSAGIAWVLASLGEAEAASELLAAADRHPLSRTCPTYGGGAAGVAMTHLYLYGRTRDERHLDTAGELLGTPGQLGPDDASGLVHGWPGVALALYYLARMTGDREPLERGLRLLRDELRHVLPVETDALGFRVSAVDQRNMPYLFAGSAGYASVLSRYLTVVEDAELADVLRRCLRNCTVRFTVGVGLFQGMAGLALTLSQAGLRAEAIRSGTGLFKYAIPGDDGGIRFVGDRFLQLSADLWSGSAGVLLAAHHLVTGAPDPLFTLDSP
ncbi:class III lanthionine synthetase LanKC [Nonomuraea sediminis]|uniref:class III lanthionine synthetase LanKC n=1 Tax=Nonomuraea sediminis TaxID=2835864 RepID=UPI001BDBD69D|nr:class III lanthionine synthetase LanKC [Nonomuraea sediminis]